MNKKIIISIGILLVCIFVILLKAKVVGQANRMRTYDTMAQIITAMDRVLRVGESPDIPKLLAEFHSIYPRSKITDGGILDAWGNVLLISINNSPEGMRLIVESAGPDGIIGDGDDLVRDGIFSGGNEHAGPP